MTTAQPRNPLRTYTFHLKLDNAAVAGVRKVSGLTMNVQAHETWEGGNSLHRYAQPDRAMWEPITLEQGLALDDTLQRWAEAVIEFLHTGRRPNAPVKRNLVLEVWDPQASPGGFATPPTAATAGAGGGSSGTGETAARPRLPLSYEIVNAWVSRYQAIPAVDAMTDEVGLLLVELTHEGWKRQDATS